MRTFIRFVLKTLVPALALACAASSGAFAQNAGSPGSSWSGTWNFGSVSDRSLGLQTAQAIRAAQLPQLAPVYNTYNTYDNRTNYQEYNNGDGTISTGAFHVGDEIGQNTNSIGSMNTGTTSIDINGSNNAVNATNGADNTGCVDGSIGLNTLGAISPTSTSGIDISIGAIQPPGTCR